MEAHRRNDVELLLQADAEDFVLVSRGQISRQVRARGTEVSGAGRSVEFESAWIELYQKRGGGWRRVGNASNFK